MFLVLSKTGIESPTQTDTESGRQTHRGREHTFLRNRLVRIESLISWVLSLFTSLVLFFAKLSTCK